jgi:hypothetical protein
MPTGLRAHPPPGPPPLRRRRAPMIIQKYNAPSGSHYAHAALLSDLPADDSASLPTLEECTDEYDDTEVSVPSSSVTFSSFLTPGRNLSQFLVVDSACSINLTAFRGDFVGFTPPPLRSLSRKRGWT